MSKLLVTTIALVFFSVVVEAIMPASTLNKYIKAVFGLMVLSVFIQTFVSFKDGFKLDYSNIYNSEMAYSINKLKVDTMCNNISYLLESNDIYGCDIKVECDMYDYNFKIEYIYIDISQVCLVEKLNNIDIKDKILSLIKSIKSIDLNSVVFYE